MNMFSLNFFFYVLNPAMSLADIQERARTNKNKVHISEKEARINKK